MEQLRVVILVNIQSDILKLFFFFVSHLISLSSVYRAERLSPPFVRLTKATKWLFAIFFYFCFCFWFDTFLGLCNTNVPLVAAAAAKKTKANDTHIIETAFFFSKRRRKTKTERRTNREIELSNLTWPLSVLAAISHKSRIFVTQPHRCCR